MDVLYYLLIEGDWPEGSVMADYCEQLESDECLEELVQAHRDLHTHRHNCGRNLSQEGRDAMDEAASLVEDAIDARCIMTLRLAAQRHSSE